MNAFSRFFVAFAVTLSSHAADKSGTIKEEALVAAALSRPAHFPHRIWAACDFEGQTPDYGWFGRAETNQIPKYPGNHTALTAAAGPYQKTSAVMTGVNPVPGPRMGHVNQLFLRYWLEGGEEATFQHFSLTREDNWHIKITGLAQHRWSELTLNFTKDARRNDGSREPFGNGERMDDLKIFAGRPEDASRYHLYVDDIIFFSNDPGLPPEPEPFPERVIFLAGFDTGPKEKYWPGEFELAESPPSGAYWRAARAVPQKKSGRKWIRIQVEPPRPVGQHTKLRFRYHATGIRAITVQVFDATVQDNRSLKMEGLTTGAWTTAYVDFARDSKRNDGTVNSPFAAGHKVDDLFFLLDGPTPNDADFHIDEVVLYDAPEHISAPQ
jgi:hypothetical protein